MTAALRFDPALGWPAVAVLAALAVAVAAWALWRGLPGWALRGLAGLVVAAALAGPVVERGARQPLSDVVIVLDDRSASQSLPGRAAQTDAAIAAIGADLAALPGVEMRRVTVADDPDGTALGAALAQALAAEPDSRVAGVIAVTDGRAHDPAAIPATAPAPVHVLTTGRPDDWDRRLVIDQAPAFGLIGQAVTVRVRVQDQGAVPAQMAGRPATLRVQIEDEPEQVIAVPPEMPVELSVPIAHAGQNVLALRLDPPPAGTVAQLTDLNDAAAVQIKGVRDRLRVLLVSGEPHPGERTWRNLLKSDANVDLIHFTILRPPEKLDGVPVDELALIAFPTQELFEQRIADFDLIILDRYRVRGLLPPDYIDNIRRYVEQGGALLVAGGPEMASVESLNLSPMGAVMPARPTGRIVATPFLPELSDVGLRHPVTAGLPGAPDADRPDAPHWGRWLRRQEIVADPGASVVMTAGDDDSPLLVLNRVGKGRVALLASDQVWLWGRGFEGGGPQLELLRRIAHWSMKEPDLDEETLLASVGPDMTLTITRRTMQDRAPPVEITDPQGRVARVDLDPAGPGRFTARWPAPGPGLYRLTDGDLSRLVALGPAAPREFEQTVASADLLAPLAQATGGTVARLADGMPQVRSSRAGRRAHGRGVGRDWIGVTPRGAVQVAALTRRDLLPGWAWLMMVGGLALGGWLVEGRGWRRGQG